MCPSQVLFVLQTKGKELKGLNREQYNELQLVKQEADYTQKLVEPCTHELVMDFQEWFKITYAVKPAKDTGSLQPAAEDTEPVSAISTPEPQLTFQQEQTTDRDESPTSSR
ncbi:MAG: Kinesin KIF9 [Trebouxia sp. A1-2]|nr:MAG: Kinesin KIF9 [Trebouxia sp. A1-2]